MALARRSRIALECKAQTTLTFWISNPGGSVGVQLRLDGDWIAEYSAPTQSSLELTEGLHLLELICADGGTEFTPQGLGVSSLPFIDLNPRAKVTSGVTVPAISAH
jgi:hypothetical protein